MTFIILEAGAFLGASTSFFIPNLRRFMRIKQDLFGLLS